MNTTFKIEKKFIRELRKRLVDAEKRPFGVSLPAERKSKIQSLPSFSELEQIVSTVFWASLLTEEGRQLRFRVGYSPPMHVAHLGLGFDLLQTKKFNLEELRRLAPAVVPPDGEICVYKDPIYSDLRILGLQAMSFLGLTFEVLDPGRIVVKYKLGQKVAEITGSEGAFIDGSLGREGTGLLSTFEKSTSSLVVDNLLSILYEKMTCEILKRIRLLGHGGTLIFVPDERSWLKSVEKPIAYNCNPRFNGLSNIETDLTSLLIGVLVPGSSTKTINEQIEEAMRELAGKRYGSAIADTARFVAYLTGVDGATVLSMNHDVIGFGVKIKEKQRKNEISVSRVSPLEGQAAEDLPLVDAFRGKRHLSAARFVSENPRAMALVVSQDGGITCITMTTSGLRAFRGFEVLI